MSRHVRQPRAPRNRFIVTSASPPRQTSQALTSRSHQRQDTAPRLDPRFYNDTQLADVTIIFGPEGEDRFEGHRLVLCNSMEWFNTNASSSHELILHGDDPEAIRSMLKWAYFGRYVEAGGQPDSLEEAKQLFLQHLNVFVVADKYAAAGLEDLALERLAELIDYYVSAPIHGRPSTEASSFMRFAVEEVFIHQTCFQFTHAISQASSPDTAYDPADAIVDDDISDEVMYAMESDDDDFFMDGGNGDPQHPADRIQAFVVKQCMRVWRSNDDNHEFNESHLQTLVSKVDGFGAAMAYEMLGYVPDVTATHDPDGDDFDY